MSENARPMAKNTSIIIILMIMNNHPSIHPSIHPPISCSPHTKSNSPTKPLTINYTDYTQTRNVNPFYCLPPLTVPLIIGSPPPCYCRHDRAVATTAVTHLYREYNEENPFTEWVCSLFTDDMVDIFRLNINKITSGSSRHQPSGAK